MRGHGRCRCFGQTSSSSPSGAAGAAHACITHQGTRSQKNGGVLPLEVHRQTPLVGDGFPVSSGWVFHCCLVLGDNARFQPAQQKHCILRAALRPFILLKAASCIIVQAVVKIKFPAEPCLAWLFITSEQVSVLPPQRGSHLVSRPRVNSVGVSVNLSTFHFTRCLLCWLLTFPVRIAIPVALSKNPCV